MSSSVRHGQRLTQWHPRPARWAAHGILGAFSLSALYPLYYMIATALKSPSDYFRDPTGIPLHPTLDSFRLAFQQGQFVIWLRNSVLVTIGATILVLVVSITAAFALGRMPFPGARPLALSTVAFLGVPPVVILIPLFLLFNDLNLIDRIPGIVLAYTALITPFGIFMLLGFVREISGELIDAAIVDGCASWKILRVIVIPLIRPAVITVAIVVALSVWNELLFALVFLQTDSKRTVMAALTQFDSRALANQPLVMAGTVLATIPMVLMYVIGFRFFQRGLMGGAFR